MSIGAPEPERIVVGVSQSSAWSYAVLWAAEEARIRRNVLLVTHIDPPTAYAPDLHDAATACHRLLANSATVASEAQPSVAVGTLLLSGAISDELLRLSRSAALIVVGIHRDVPRAAHGTIGSIEDRVLVQAHCPVVTVAAAPQEVKGHRGYVAVGWSPDASGAGALAAAAAEAAVRGVSLTVVPGPGPAGEALRSSDLGGSAERDLHQALTAVAQQHPGVATTIDWPAHNWIQTLINHSTHADLLVIGSHHSDDRWSIRVGASVEAVLRQATGPVMLIGGSRSTPAAFSQLGPPTRPEPVNPALSAS
jgi:nucleotide-binding universal stress UspA family protein